MPTSLNEINLSLLTELLPEPDPIEDTKHRIQSVSLILWYVHQWQSDEEDERKLSLLIKKEVSLTKMQLAVIGQITRTTPEPEVLRLVTYALDNPHEKGSTNGNG